MTLSERSVNERSIPLGHLGLVGRAKRAVRRGWRPAIDPPAPLTDERPGRWTPRWRPRSFGVVATGLGLAVLSVIAVLSVLAAVRG